MASLNYFCCNYFSRGLIGGHYSHVYSKATSLAREAIANIRTAFGTTTMESQSSLHLH